MCLLTFMHAGCTPDINDLKTGADNNPDGFGFAIHAGTHIVHASGLNFDAVLDRFLTERQNHSGPALFHSRITTHGGTSLENCHPFQVGRDTNTIMAHNGMLPINARDGKSDTRIFAEELFPSWGGASTLNSKRMRKKLSKFADGSKLVFLSANPDVQNDFYIINENLGHWDNGVWWSNNSYKWSTYSYATTWKKHDKRAYAWDLDDDEDDYGLRTLAGNVEDCSYIDPDTGEEVWGEIWTCLGCGNELYVHDNTMNVDYCDVCDSCWYCSDSRRYCFCYTDAEDRPNTTNLVDPFGYNLVDADRILESAELNQPTLWGYDTSIKQGSMY